LDFVCPQRLQIADWNLFEQILKRTVARNFAV
jgi:hypothetical protein